MKSGIVIGDERFRGIVIDLLKSNKNIHPFSEDTLTDKNATTFILEEDTGVLYANYGSPEDLYVTYDLPFSMNAFVYFVDTFRPKGLNLWEYYVLPRIQKDGILVSNGSESHFVSKEELEAIEQLSSRWNNSNNITIGHGIIKVGCKFITAKEYRDFYRKVKQKLG